MIIIVTVVTVILVTLLIHSTKDAVNMKLYAFKVEFSTHENLCSKLVCSIMTVVTGLRTVGNTSFAWEFAKGKTPAIYSEMHEIWDHYKTIRTCT